MAADLQDTAKPAARPVILEYASPGTRTVDRVVFNQRDDGFDYIFPALSPQVGFVIRQAFVLLVSGSFSLFAAFGMMMSLQVDLQTPGMCLLIALVFGLSFWNAAASLAHLLRNNRKLVAISVRNASLRLVVQQGEKTTSHAWNPGSLRSTSVKPLRRGLGCYDCWELRVEPASGPEVRVAFLIYLSAPAFLNTSLREALGLAPALSRRKTES